MIPTVCSIAAALAAAALAAWSGPVLYVDDSAHPRYSLSWETTDGETIVLEGQRPYTTPEQRGILGYNVEAFVAVGGTRLDKGAGRESGAILRIGFYKSDPKSLFFTDIREGSPVTITMDGVRFAGEGVPVPETALQHLKYTLADVRECGLSDEAKDQYNTRSADDTMNGQITPDNARMASLDGKADERSAENGQAAPLEGEVKVWLADDGSVSLRALVPYAMFRHVRDPWMRSDPGGFFEPYHFHLEFEAIPLEVWKQEFPDRPLPRAEEGEGDAPGGA
ncbi:MAG: hypothetical protein ACF8R7_01795 [Phycisphaerales bacterium JB039]